MFRVVLSAGLLTLGASQPIEAQIPRGAESFRCGVRLINIGDSPATVESACGPPTEKVHLKRTFRGRRGRMMTVEEDVWTYDMGSTRLVRFLVFAHGAVSSIASGKHGTSPR